VAALGYAIQDASERGRDLARLELGEQLTDAGGERLLRQEQAAATIRRGVSRRAEYAVRLISLPRWELFDAQPREYGDAVLQPAVA